MNPSPAHGIRPGLASVTFRHLSVERVVTLASDAGLLDVEWAGDVHVSHGNLAAAWRARRLCADAGLAVSTYGSYYRAGMVGAAAVSFPSVLETALELGAPAIRVWAGGCGSADADPDVWRRVRDDLAAACDLAAAHDLRVALEYHSGTLTDTARSTSALVEAVDRPNLRSSWQPRHGDSLASGVRDLLLHRPHLGDLHVFHWWPDESTRLPLADGADRWQAYLRAAAADGRPRVAAIEFVRGGDEAQFALDAATLHSLLCHLPIPIPKT